MTTNNKGTVTIATEGLVRTDLTKGLVLNDGLSTLGSTLPTQTATPAVTRPSAPKPMPTRDNSK